MRHSAGRDRIELPLIYVKSAEPPGSSLAPMGRRTDWVSLAAGATIVLTALAIVVIFAS